jgi:hypothetical protein
MIESIFQIADFFQFYSNGYDDINLKGGKKEKKKKKTMYRK